jgi:hypothetical protein
MSSLIRLFGVLMKVDWKIVKKTRWWLAVGCCFGYFMSFVIYLCIQPIWTASLDIAIKLPKANNNPITMTLLSTGPEINIDYLKIFNSIGNPIFTKELIDLAGRPDLFNMLLGRRFAGQGGIEVLSKSADGIALIVKAESPSLALMLAKKISDLLTEKIDIEAKNASNIIDRLIRLNDTYRLRLEHIAKMRNLEELEIESDSLFLHSINLEYLFKLNIAQHEVELRLNALKEMAAIYKETVLTDSIYLYPLQIWPRPKLIGLLGTVLALSLMLIILVWTKALFRINADDK